MTDALGAEDRYRREQDFHDRRFGSEARAADGFYAINGACEAHYERALGPVGPGTRVLEYGCGTGSAAFALAAEGADVLGIDLSPVAVAAATDRAAELGLATARFSVMNAEALTASDAAFDLVCGSGILHHLDLDRALGEVARVLADDGRATFLEPLGHNPAINLYRRATPGMRTDDEHPLRAEDLQGFERWFTTVRCTSFVLFALAALPFRRSPRVERIVGPLDRIDRALFDRFPRTARFAWTTVVELEGPRR